MYVPHIPLKELRHRISLRDSSLRFGVTGILREGALVLYDRQTYSVWKQDGVAIGGPLQGMRLRRFPSERLRWEAWLARHPDTLVMAPPRP